MTDTRSTGSTDDARIAPGRRVAVVIPSLGGPQVRTCLRALASLEPPPTQKILVLSGGADQPADTAGCTVRSVDRRLGYAAAVNTGIRETCDDADYLAVINDDALPPRGWLAVLGDRLDEHPDVAAIQGTLTSEKGSEIDGRGITLDPYGLPVQVDRGQPFASDKGERALIAVSGTACVYRMKALRNVAFGNGSVFDEAFGSYHEDLDLGLRLRRKGWRAMWAGGVPVAHLGSASGRRFAWRHPWWLLANRWRAIGGNFTARAVLRRLPRLLRGELRAIRTLMRSNPRAALAAVAVFVSIPALLLRGWNRATPGARLSAIPEDTR